MSHRASSPAASLRTTLAPALLGLAAVLALFEFTSLDLLVQDQFFDFARGRWIVDRDETWGRAIFYNGPKHLVWLCALTALALAAGPAAWRERWQLSRRGLWVAVLTLTTLPALAGLGKNLTNVFCPSEIRRYGGAVPYVALCGAYPVDDRPTSRGHCFPAGHASGGFALIALALVRPSRRWRRGGILVGLTLGWWMGGYQMLKGAHYLSHTLVTMLLAWVVLAMWQRVLAPRAASVEKMP